MLKIHRIGKSLGALDPNKDFRLASGVLPGFGPQEGLRVLPDGPLVDGPASANEVAVVLSGND